MAGCCNDQPAMDNTTPAYRRVLWTVIGLNLGMFVVEMFAGLKGQSLALQADALDFLGDGLTYGLSLAVLGSALRVRATAALIKGASLALLAAWILGSAVWRVFFVGDPSPLVMSTVGLLALATNAVSALLLMRYRHGDANVRSVWLCSRNDAIGNVAVIAAAGLVAVTSSAWPDLVVAAAMASLFLSSSTGIIRQARAELREEPAVAEVSVR
ncbi:cation transporter [Halofilum ochraceum]|uniref:cation transporter n=1 Tax=Halofilum ochraceum TaxID=1611323 RepID=UPI0008312C8F|nr:cation transporter [Halofilum ochraceum]